jgi:hypothetical protein
VELAEGVDRLPLAFVGGVRRSGFQHAHERECCSREQCAAEGNGAVARIAVVTPQSLL